jgi:hypothetical protein
MMKAGLVSFVIKALFVAFGPTRGGRALGASLP